MKRASLYTILVLLSIAPGLLAVRAYGQNVSYTSSTDDGTRHVRWSDGFHTLEVRARGELAFNDDMTAVDRISRDGYLIIEEEKGARDYRLEVRAGDDGAPEYQYFVRGRRQPFDVEGKDWLAEVLPDVVRNTGIGAEARVQKILADEGVDAVMDEIERIKSSSARYAYASALVKHGKMSPKQLERFAREVISDIPSSGTKAHLLMDTAGLYLTNADLSEAYFDAVATIASSGDRTHVLLAAMKVRRLDAKQLVSLLEAARQIPSSGDKARLLLEVAPRYISGNEDMRRAYFSALNAIPSSGDRAHVLLTLLENDKQLDDETITELFYSAERIPSSGDKARLLMAVSSHYVDNPKMRSAYFGAVKTIASSGDRARTLMSLIEKVDLDKDSWLALFDAASGIPSSGDRARVLVEASPKIAGDDELVKAYLEAANGIPSSGERARVLSALLEQ